MRLTPFEVHVARSMSLGIAGYRDHLFHVPRLLFHQTFLDHTFYLQHFSAPRSHVSAESVGLPEGANGVREVWRGGELFVYD